MKSRHRKMTCSLESVPPPQIVCKPNSKDRDSREELSPPTRFLPRQLEALSQLMGCTVGERAWHSGFWRKDRSA